jgi:hypothetical protein
MNPFRFDEGGGKVLLGPGYLHPFAIGSMTGRAMLKVELLSCLDHLAVSDFEILVELHATVPTGKGFIPIHVDERPF